MLLHHLFEAGLTARPAVDSDAFRQWFRTSQVVDAHGNPLAVYHGTGRPDRVGTQFRKSRATAGPMAYFTDDPAVASSYATGKADTSIDDDDYITYATWFKIKPKGSRSEVTLDRAWHFLPHDERQRIAVNGPKVRQEEDEIFVEADNDNGCGSYKSNLQQCRGNVLKAMTEDWLSSGILFGDEVRFLEVLRLAGMTTPVRFDHPHTTTPAVYAVYLSIQRPLVSTAIPDAVFKALGEAASRQRAPRSTVGQWDKNSTDGRQWFRELLDDYEKTGGMVSWTVVPDWVTAVLKRFGYDGIKDVGGKNGGPSHVVWIPFDDRQVKSALSNSTFDPSKPNIHA